MLSVSIFKTAPHKANAIDKRAIANLRYHIESEIELNNLNINKTDLLDESNYIIVEIEGYENIAFLDYDSKMICETVQPIDRGNNKLFPIQKVEIKPYYKRF